MGMGNALPHVKRLLTDRRSSPMPTTSRSLAILATNPAFAELLCQPLEAEGYRIASFESHEALTTYLRIAPVDAVVIDTDRSDIAATELARNLRHHPRLAPGHFKLVALTRTLPAFHQSLHEAGIDKVLVKPVTPGQLLASITQAPARQKASRPPAVPQRRPQPRQVVQERRDNVIPLFGRRVPTI